MVFWPDVRRLVQRGQESFACSACSALLSNDGHRFSGARLPKTFAMMLDQKLEARLDLAPGLQTEQLLGVVSTGEMGNRR